MQRSAGATRARARKSGPRAVSPHLVAVRSRRRSSRGRRGLEARCRSVFTTAVALLIALTSLGLARVAVIARAAEMTISADSLARRIKQQRVETDRLEIDRSSLSAPSRIEGIAADTMSMGDPASVSYITLPPSGDEASALVPDGTAGPARPESGTPSAVERLTSAVSALLDVSAGEAQSLLVGDLALAGSR